MQAAASLAPVNPPAAFDATLPAPVVLVDGIPHPTAHVTQATADYPTDQRAARIQIDPTSLAPGDPATQASVPQPPLFPPISPAATAIVARPVPLVGNSQDWQVLAVGSIQPADTHLQADTTEHTHLLLDRYTDALDQAPRTESRQPLETAADLHSALIQIARELRLSIQLDAVTNRPLPKAIDASSTIGGALDQVLIPNRLHLRLNRRLIAGRLTESLTVLPDRFAPQHRLEPDAPTVVSYRSTAAGPRPILYAVEAAPRRIESTFELQPGYPDSLTAEPDSFYSPDTSPDWPRYAPVFRRWVLNDDHAGSNATPFDLAQLFDDPEVTPTTAALQNCLTLDAAGNPLPPQLEASLDDGTTYTLSTLGFQTDPQRAAITLTDATLPPGLLAAARNQQLRLRVTASLTSPRPTRLARFRGNPFLNPVHQTTTRYDDLRFNTLHPNSIHAERVTAGQLQTNTRDDTRLLRERLTEALAEAQPAATIGQAWLTLAGTNLAHTPGDRVAVGSSTLTVQSTTSRFDRSQTVLTLHPD